MPNQMPSGLKTHDATPAAYGCLGRRGDNASMQKARRMMKGKPTPPGIRHGSPNHHLIQALINAVVFSDYVVADEYLKLIRKHGIGEGGSNYFPSGCCGYMLPLIRAAELDGRDSIAQQGREFMARVLEWMEPMTIDRPPSRVISWLPSGEHVVARGYQPTGQGGHVFFPGSRALYHPPDGAGWYAEAPATVLYQWLTGAPGRSLPGRYASYVPKGVDGVWDSWPWMVATIYGLIPAKATPQPHTLAKAFRTKTLPSVLADDPGPYKLKFGMQVVRLRNGSMLCTASHRTAGPKPPVNFVEYHEPSGGVRLAAPDGLIAYGATGKGSIEWTGTEVWARAENDKGTVMPSRRYKRSDVVSHQVMPPKSSGPWQEGKLHPKTEEPEPPRPGPETPGDDEPSWWVRHRLRAIAGVAFLAAIVVAVRGCF